MTFVELGLHEDLLKGIADLGFEAPMPIQTEAIPHILAGRDVIACAETGSGKTAAFMLPILHRLLMDDVRPQGPRALVLAPTRELALQSSDHIAALAKYINLRGTAIFGGVPMNPQIRALSEGVDVISATPGRLLDHASNRRINFSSIHTLVLDEADRIMDMGFLPDIRRIVSLLPAQRQNVIVSATMPAEIMHLMNQMCNNPVTIQIGEKSRVPENIRHAIYPVTHEQKAELLLKILKDMPDISSVIVFTRTKERADRLADMLAKNGIRTARMHGNLDQRARQKSLEGLKSGDLQVLVATDLVARGIDIKDLSHVVNYDPPETPETYIHRIGRTGRVDAEGDAFTLMAPPEEPWIKAIETAIGKTIPRVTVPDFAYKKSEVHGSYHPRPFYIPSWPKGGNRGGRGGPRGGTFGRGGFGGGGRGRR